MGNSLTKPREFVDALLQWLSTACGGRFVFIGKKLPVGSQRDTTSCGFFAVNAILHDVFGTALLAHLDIRANRLQWFNDLCDAVVQCVILFPVFSKIPIADKFY